MKKTEGYAGRITNRGAQRVEAPIKQTAPKSGKVHRGEDLRAAKKA